MASDKVCITPSGGTWREQAATFLKGCLNITITFVITAPPHRPSFTDICTRLHGHLYNCSLMHIFHSGMVPMSECYQTFLLYFRVVFAVIKSRI